MPTLNDTTNQTAKKSDWSDNLLIKDKKGKFHHLNEPARDENVGPFAKKDDENSHNLSLAPANDSFSDNKYISGSAESKSELIFHPEDDQQLKEIAKTVPLDDSRKYSIDKIVDKLIEKQSLKLDEGNSKIFTDIIFDFFRNRKKGSVVREALSNKVKSDKGALASDVIDNIMSVIKGIKNKVDTQGGLVVRTAEIEKAPIAIEPEIKAKAIPNFEPPKIVYDLDKEEDSGDLQNEVAKFLTESDNIETPIELGETEEKPKIVQEGLGQMPSVNFEQKDLSSEEKSTNEEDEEKPIPVKINPVVTIQDPKTDEGFEMPKKKPEIPKEEPKIEVPVETPKPIEPTPPPAPAPEVSLPKVVRPNQKVDSKTQINDVKPKIQPMPSFAPKHVLTGPVQELQDLDLHAWRNLGSDAQSRADRLMEKVDSLEKESFTKKAQGIEAWRKSGVYQNYLELGANSMAEGIEVSALIDKYKQEGKDVLSIDEFSAISDLNKKLRF